MLKHRTSTGDDDQRGHESGLLSDYHKNMTHRQSLPCWIYESPISCWAMADQAFKKDHVKTTIQNYPSKHQNGATLDIAAEYSFKPKNKNIDSYFTTREVNDYIDHY